jgi:hypothetical protein
MKHDFLLFDSCDFEDQLASSIRFAGWKPSQIPPGILILSIEMAGSARCVVPPRKLSGQRGVPTACSQLELLGNVNCRYSDVCSSFSS